MSAGTDELWVDMTQFDTRIADAVWDGTARDPDAPPWYRDLRSLIHRARGPAEVHELIDEPLVVNTMRRVRLGSSIARLPRRSGVRTVGRVLAMKAAALTTTGVIGVAAATAATTGIVATVAATVVVPVVKDHVVAPVINTITPAVIPAEVASPPTTEGAHSTAHLDGPASGDGLAALPPVEIQVPSLDVPAAPVDAEPAAVPALSEPAAVPTTPDEVLVEPTVVAEAPAEEVPAPVPDETVVTDPAPVPDETVVTDPTPVPEEPPFTEEPSAADPTPVVDPPPTRNQGAPMVNKPETPVEPVSPVEPARHPDQRNGDTARAAG